MRGENVEAMELRNVEDLLVSQERILAEMKVDASKLQAVDSWCGFFVEMKDDGDVTNTQ